MQICHLVCGELQENSAQGKGPVPPRTPGDAAATPSLTKCAPFFPSPCSGPAPTVQPVPGRGTTASTGLVVKLRNWSGARLLQCKAHPSKQRAFSCHWREDTIVTSQLTNEGEKHIWEATGSEYLKKIYLSREHKWTSVCSHLFCITVKKHTKQSHLSIWTKEYKHDLHLVIKWETTHRVLQFHGIKFRA